MKKDDDKKGVRGEAEAPVEAPKVTEALRAENAELLADLQRTRADFENYRKQVEIQRDAAVRMGQLSTVRRVLPLLDDIDRAIQTYTELAPLKKSLEKTLTSLDLVKIPAEVGMEFDPEKHEAVMAEGEGDVEEIAEVLRPGYEYNGELLRSAMVKVYKKD